MIRRKNNFTLIEVLVSVALFSMMSIVLMDTFQGTKDNIRQMLNREAASMMGLSVLSEIQESVHQAAEIYNHVPVSSGDDSENNLFYQRIDWDDIPKRMGDDLGNPDYHNRLPDVKGQTQAISDWKAANLTDDYANRFHDNDILMSLQPNGPGIPAGTRGYAGNFLFLARHLQPIEIIMSPTDSDFSTAAANTESQLYQQTRLHGNQILIYTGGDAMPGDERMYAIDVVRFEIYYLTEDKTGNWRKMLSTNSESLYREHSLRLVKAESNPYLVHSKFENFKNNLQASYDIDQAKVATELALGNVYIPVVPNDFVAIFEALTSTSEGIFFDSITKSKVRGFVTHTVEYIDSSAGLVLRELDSGASNGFSTDPTTDNLQFPESKHHLFLNNHNMNGKTNISVAYNTKWTSGDTLTMSTSKHVPWFAQQPELMNVSPTSELFPGGFEISGSGFGNKQRIGMRLCLWLRTVDESSSYSHFMIGGRAQ
ncbi:MAG: hypothetical protein COA79_03895 [Planctomycetota bacterium]|nr:MAG: hypothetical protein COA79_03895 [Planctomycetota bacterium]